MAKSHKNQQFTISLADTFLKKLREGSNCPPSLFRIKNISISLWLISTRDCKPCIFAKCKTSDFHLYIQGSNFPKQYHALNTVFRLFDSYVKISNIFWKINYDSQNFQAYTEILIDVKVSKYSIKWEAVIRRCIIKNQFWRVLNISQKKTYTRASFEIKLQAYNLKLLFKKRLLHKCFPIKFAKYSRAHFLQNTSGRLLL